MPMPQASSKPRRKRNLYNSSKLRENCCANCKKPFKGKDEHLKMTYLMLPNSDTRPQVSVVESISSIFDGYLKLKKISLNQAMNMYLCIPCASTISSLYKIFKKFMESTSPKSIMKDIIQDSPFWEESTAPQAQISIKSEVIARSDSDSDGNEQILPDDDFQTEDQEDDDWPGDDGDDAYNDNDGDDDYVPSNVKVDRKRPVKTGSPVSKKVNSATKNFPSVSPSKNATSSRPSVTKTPNVRLDKSWTYRQMLEMKKSGTTLRCTYVPNESLAPGEDPKEVKDLKRGSRVCPYCQWTFRSMTELHEHLLTIAKIETYACPYPNCEPKFAWDCFYAKHLASVHSELFSNRGCEKCPMTFNTQYELLEHESQHEEQDLWVSDMENPPKTLKKQQRVKYHGTYYFPCIHLHCGKLFLEKQYLKRHIENCHEAPPLYRCDRCPWVFPKQDLLAEHSVCHTGELAFTCEQCGEKFNNRKSMENHIYHFHRKRQANYEEDDASKKRRKKSRANPMPTISPRKHKCEECDKAFAKRSNLIQHVRMDHQGLEPLECKICSQRFASDEARMLHEDTFVHKEFACPDCSKIFYKQARLDAHSDSHIPVLRDKVKIATHICETCGKMFKLATTLARHLLKHDSVIPDDLVDNVEVDNVEVDDVEIDQK